LNREQYGDEPLFKGRFFDSRPTDMTEGKKVYRKDGDRYVVAKRTSDYTYDKETLFPRIYSEKNGHPTYYRDYLGLGPNDSPTFADNLKFFFGYQVGHMYGRFFLLNIAGLPYDHLGKGGSADGYMISVINQ